MNREKIAELYEVAKLEDINCNAFADRILDLLKDHIDPNAQVKRECEECGGTGRLDAHVYCNKCEKGFVVPYKKKDDTYCTCGQQMLHKASRSCLSCTDGSRYAWVWEECKVCESRGWTCDKDFKGCPELKWGMSDCYKACDFHYTCDTCHSDGRILRPLLNREVLAEPERAWEIVWKTKEG